MSALVQIIAWRQTGDKPLFEAMLVHFTDAHICITRPQWVKSPGEWGDIPYRYVFPDGPQAITWNSVTNQWDLEAFICGQFHRKCSRYLPLIWVWKSQPNSPGAHELKHPLDTVSLFWDWKLCIMYWNTPLADTLPIFSQKDLELI